MKPKNLAILFGNNPMYSKSISTIDLDLSGLIPNIILNNSYDRIERELSYRMYTFLYNPLDNLLMNNNILKEEYDGGVYWLGLLSV